MDIISELKSVSVVIPAFNVERFLSEALISINNQTIKPKEIIVVDDCSTDSTLQIALAFKRLCNLTIISNKKNLGIGGTRQVGVDAAEGNYIAFLSADDAYCKKFLEKSMKYIRPNTATFTNYFRCDEELNQFTIFNAPSGNFKHHCLAYALEKNMFINFSSIVLPKDIFDKCEFKKDLRHGEDLIFLLDSILEGLNWHHIKAPLIYYRVHSKQGTHLRHVCEWCLLWNYLSKRLKRFGYSDKVIIDAKKHNYQLLYPRVNFSAASKHVVRRCLSRSPALKERIKSMRLNK